MRFLLALALLFGPQVTFGQGFAGLGTSADGFAIPAPEPEFSFPDDHGPHPDFRIEWWYLTATLEDAAGNAYGIQWTLFRSALAPETSNDWTAPQLLMGHAGLTTADAHFSAERLARGGIGQAGVTTQPFRAFIDDWQMSATASEGDALDALTLSARGADFAYDLELQADGPLIFHGDVGYSVKSAEGQASYYYSQPFYDVTGTLMLPSGPVAVTGSGWLDREWSSQPLSDTQSGWEWFSLQLPEGARLMAFALRDDTDAPFTSATYIAADGTTQAYGDGAITLTPLATHRVAGRDVPVEWRLEFPERDIDITTRALNPNSWMDTSFPYWEGPISFTGTHAGRGYLEMTGYD
ncbi:iron ABC transporter permease [Gymnodinialimonas ceratoperidinii]|uniref:Iron ABC transporter permease n=2 Tax=Gymnodinialimonas ceratoperidinii TaxID=2856823 RepID=A0A8F6TWP8_9RHOB|nr:lipocalin-like domain-containing protein [Gymnodinialimonas ceratoperidinii]QXT40055.1 iron ABC transporter permease [Gymnodinialimonas ceratoperidinii]